MINQLQNNTGIYIKASELAKILSVHPSTVNRWLNKANCKYVWRTAPCNGGESYEVLISSLELNVQEKIKLLKPELFSSNLCDDLSGGVADSKNAPIFLNNNSKVIPEKAKKLALAKVDLINLWENFRNPKPDKRVADLDFINMYNCKLISTNLFSIIGKTSIQSLYRWQKSLKDANGHYEALVPGYKYGSESEYNTSLSQIEQAALKDLMLRDAKIRTGTAYRMITYGLQLNGYTGKFASYKAYVRFMNNFVRNKNGIYTVMRDGQKALADKVLPYIKRNPKLLNVGDVLVADGNVLDFMVKNPETGRPCRATLIVYVDWKSEDIAGYEIMLTENTQCIASALRNSILRLGKIPKISYQDNGRAFKSKFFRGDINLEECGFNGIFSALGIQPVFATPYNAKAKIVERVFREFTQTFSSLMPSYVGNCITNRPAHLKRNEKFQKSISSDYVPTIQEAVNALEEWLKFYRSQPCPHVKGKTIGEVFENGRGDGIEPDLLNDLMMAQTIRTVGRNGVQLFNQLYYSEELTGIKDEVVVKYSLTDIFSVKIYSQRGEFICTAEAIQEIHPMAEYLGTAKDVYSFKRALKAKKKAEQKIMQEAYKTVPRLKKNLKWETIEPTKDAPKIENKKVKKLLPRLDNVNIAENKYGKIRI